MEIIRNGFSFGGITFGAFGGVGFYKTAQLITMRWWNALFPDNIEKNRNSFIVPYRYADQDYKIFVRKNKNRNRVISITDHNNKDVSEDVRQYMGPFLDFHGMQISPKDLGYEKLVFTLLSGDVKEYGEYDIIIV